ncbi:Cleavage stimulation factor subunit 1 [Trichinella zimbabwensis]|uniref:Cleavage stimulation factor 50 kDa subunit n=2 Tax=Trichinella TaxID=6333 RepID=A0A0V1HVE1_9BILA|nr:Cleavage stimulation factor subunit 1 [Trichinella zimbabwensis]
MSSAPPISHIYQQMYRLIISQLMYDGYIQLASTLRKTVNEGRCCGPSEKLFEIVKADIIAQESFVRDDSEIRERNISCLNLATDADTTATSPELCLYETIFITAHKDVCRACAFNIEGTLIATGSADASIKIMDVERALNRDYSPFDSEPEFTGADTHPVIRTLYDHIDEVKCLAFHSNEYLLASGSKDCTVKFFDFSKASAKRACKTILEVAPVRALAFHPLGEHVIVGTENPVLRMYVVETSSCFVSPVPADQHVDAITDLQYLDTGRCYASASKDGSVKIWDGVSCRCTNTFANAHDGSQVCSVKFSRNGKYLLTSGRDGVVKLWELRANRCLIIYTGASSTGLERHRIQAVFNHNEDYVLYPEEHSNSLCSWDSRTGERKRLLALGHTAPVRGFAHSPTQAAFVSCSDDFRARFWLSKTSTD